MTVLVLTVIATVHSDAGHPRQAVLMNEMEQIITALWNLQVPHEATDACAKVHCAFHMVDEPGEGYHICGECWHLFRSKRDLIQQHRKMLREMRCSESLKIPWFSNEWATGRLRWWWINITLRADKIYSCPFCAHDF